MFKPLSRYADFQGRSRRSEFWLWVLVNSIVVGILCTILVFAMFSTFHGLAQRAANGEFDAYVASGGAVFPLDYMGQRYWLPSSEWGSIFAAIGIPAGILCLWYLFTLIPTLAVQIRRLHDQDMSGWFILIPLVNFILIGFMGGTPGPNRFGPNPRGF